MSATIRVGLDLASIAGYHWVSENAALADMLNALLPAEGPSGADPDPDLTAAEKAAELLGGEVLVFDEFEDEDEDVIY